MAYEFAADEPVRDAILRCSRELLDQAVTDLSEGMGDDPVRAVHEARKAIKKQRSLLRLARGTMPADQRRRENAALRAAARELSDVRDADVMIATIHELSDRFVAQLPARTFAAIAKDLEARRSAGARGRDGGRPNTRASQELGAVRLRVDEWSLARGGWKAIERGLMRSYRRGRKALRRAERSRTMEDLHDWRKRVKDLWYHERLLAPICGPAMHGQAKDAHQLADLLGDDHDLGVLRSELTRGGIQAPVDTGAVIRLIDHRREELQTEALAIGSRIYAESPERFRVRTRRAWDAGRRVAKASLERDPAELAAATREPGPE